MTRKCHNHRLQTNLRHREVHLCKPRVLSPLRSLRTLKPFGEVGGDVPEYFSSCTHFAKIEDKKVIAKISSKTYQLECNDTVPVKSKRINI